MTPLLSGTPPVTSGLIRIRGARQNNLKNLDLDLQTARDGVLGIQIQHRIQRGARIVEPSYLEVAPGEARFSAPPVDSSQL